LQEGVNDMTIIKHEMKANFKTLLIWGITVGAMLFTFMIMFPAMKDTLTQMGDLYSNMQGFSSAFGMDKLSIYTAMGYYGTEVGAVLSLSGALFAALLGAGMLSKEEGGHTAEFLLSSPISRSKVVLQKLIAMILNIFLFNLICILSALLSFALIKDTINLPNFLLYHLTQFTMHTEIACICFCISAFAKKQNLGLGLGIATLLYFTDILEKVVSDLDFLKYVTPFTYSNAADIFSTGKIDGVLISIGIVISVLAVVIGYLKYTRKDIVA
jgi:ABC-2 type transport system permease protein